MRNAATALGLIGGVLALIMGMASYGYTEALYRWEELTQVLNQPENVDLVRGMSVIAPLLAIAGAAMARYRALWGGAALAVAAVGMYMAFGVGFFSIFPIAMCGLAAILAIAARQPDVETSH
ncbi:MAG: hypothetical protein OXQ92_00210 [Boseongicola sp.]|nr:hypothetical protein [Boseongicola sp.]MDD9977719.1 hypothetical protein [Boseongicola sp.]